MVIPAVCILAVTLKGVNGTIVESLLLRRWTIVRDGFFFILAEICLIIFLGTGALTWWMGLVLMGIYSVYFAVLLRGFGQEEDDEETEEDSDEEEEIDDRSIDHFGSSINLFGVMTLVPLAHGPSYLSPHSPAGGHPYFRNPSCYRLNLLG